MLTKSKTGSRDLILQTVLALRPIICNGRCAKSIGTKGKEHLVTTKL